MYSACDISYRYNSLFSVLCIITSKAKVKGGGEGGEGEEDHPVVEIAFNCGESLRASFIIHKMGINNKYFAKLLGLHELT